MVLINRGKFLKLLPATIVLGTGIVLAGCGKSHTASPTTPSSAAVPPPVKRPLVLPKVPFANQPCRSLSAAELKTLGFAASSGMPARAPSGLPYANLCVFGKVLVGYVTKQNYDSNQTSNHDASRTAPADLPGAFYGKQGGLWFAKDGYYVVVHGNGALEEKVAAIVAGKL